MTTSLFDLFKFSKLLNVTDGKMELMNTPVNVIPTSILCNQQKMLIETLGLEKAYRAIYADSKQGSLDYNKKFISNQGFQDKRKILDWQVKIVAFAGWGELEVAKLDIEKSELVIHFKHSPYPKSYGHAGYPVDFVSTGFVAGGLTVMFGKDVDAYESKCEAKGDPFCQIEVGDPTTIKSKRLELWQSLKLV